MRVFGIGIDIVETARIKRSMERFGDKFLDRLFTAREREYCDRMKFSERHYAARFAAKEAISKTFGTGIGEHSDWTDLEILRRETGEPYVVLQGAAKAFADKHGITELMISLSHADDYAAANAMALCGDGRPKQKEVEG